MGYVINLDNRFKQKNIDEIAQKIKDNGLDGINLDNKDIILEYSQQSSSFFVNTDKSVGENRFNSSRYGIDSIELNYNNAKQTYFVEKSKQASNRILASIDEDSIYVLSNDKNKEVFNLQKAIKIIMEYAKENKIDSKLNFNYIIDNNSIINHYIPLFTKFENHELIKDKRNVELATLIGTEFKNINYLNNAVEIYKEMNLKNFLLKENFYFEIAKECYQHYKANNTEVIDFFANVEQNLPIKENSLYQSDVLLSFLVKGEEYVSENLFEHKLTKINQLLGYAEKYKSSQTYNGLKRIFNNITELDEFLQQEHNSFLATKIHNFLGSNLSQIQLIVPQAIQQQAENFNKSNFNKVIEVFSVTQTENTKERTENFVLTKNNADIENTLAVFLANDNHNYNLPKTLYDFTGIDTILVKNAIKKIKNCMIVSDDLLALNLPTIKKDGKFYTFQYNKTSATNAVILDQNAQCKNYEDTNEVLMSLNHTKREMAFSVINTTNERDFSYTCSLIKEENAINNFLKSQQCFNAIKQISLSENRKTIPTSLKTTNTMQFTSEYTENPQTSIELQDNLYINESKEVFSVLSPNQRKKESITFAGNGFTRNSVFPLFLSINTQEEKDKIQTLCLSALQEYKKDLEDTQLQSKIHTNFWNELEIQTIETINNPENIQLSISIHQAMSDDLIVPVEYFKAITEFGQYAGEIPIPSNYIYNELEKENIINKNTMLEIPKVGLDLMKRCITTMYNDTKELLQKEGFEEKLKEIISKDIKIDIKDYENTDTYNQIKEEIAKKYSEKIYNFSNFDSVTDTLDLYNKARVSNYIFAKHISVDNKDIVINPKDFEDLNLELKTELSKEKYEQYEQALAEFVADSSLRDRMNNILTKTFINHELLSKKLDIYNFLNKLNVLLKKIPNKEHSLAQLITNKEIDEKLVAKLQQIVKSTDINKSISEIIIQNEQVLAAILQGAYVKNFTNKFAYVNGVKKHQLETMLSALLRPDSEIGINFSARAGKTLTSMLILLTAQAYKDKAEFYVYSKNIRDITKQFFYFLPEYAHKMQFQLSSPDEKKMNFLKDDNIVVYRNNNDILINIPTKLDGLLNADKNISKKSAKIILSDGFLNKINLIDQYIKDKGEKEVIANISKSPAFKLYNTLIDLEKNYTTKSSTRAKLLMTTYLHSIFKEKYINANNLNIAIDRVANTYLDKFLSKTVNKSDRYLTIASNNILKKTITQGEEVIKDDQNLVIEKTKYDKGSKTTINKKGKMIEFERPLLNSNEDMIDLIKDKQKALNSLKNIFNKYDFSKNSKIKALGEKGELVIVPIYDKKLTELQMFYTKIEDKNKKINKQIVQNIYEKAKNNFQDLQPELITIDYINNIIAQLNTHINEKRAVRLNLLDICENKIENDKDLKNIVTAINDIQINNESVRAYSIKVDEDKLDFFINNVFVKNEAIENLILLKLIDTDSLKNIIKDNLNPAKLNLIDFQNTLALALLPRPNVVSNTFEEPTANKALRLFAQLKGNQSLKLLYREKPIGGMFDNYITAPAFVADSGNYETSILNFVKVYAEVFQPEKEQDLLLAKDFELEICTNTQNGFELNIVDCNDVKITSKTAVALAGDIAFLKNKTKEKSIVALDEYHKNTGQNANYGEIVRKNILREEQTQAILITATPKRREFVDLSMKQMNDKRVKLLLALKQLDTDDIVSSIFKKYILSDNKDISLSEMFFHKLGIDNVSDIVNDICKDKGVDFIITDEDKKNPNKLGKNVDDFFNFETMKYAISSNIDKEVDYDNNKREDINFNIDDFDFWQKYASNQIDLKIHIPTTQVVYANLNLENSNSYSIINSLPFRYDIKTTSPEIANWNDRAFLTQLISTQKYFSTFGVSNSLRTLKQTIDVFRSCFDLAKDNAKIDNSDDKYIRHNINEIEQEINSSYRCRYTKNFKIKDFWASDNRTVPNDGASILQLFYQPDYAEQCAYYINADFSNSSEKEKNLSDKYRVADYLIDNYLNVLLENRTSQIRTLSYNENVIYTDHKGKTKSINNALRNMGSVSYFTNINNLLFIVSNNKNNDECEIKELREHTGWIKNEGLICNSPSLPNSVNVKTKINLEFDETYFRHFFPRLSEYIDFNNIQNYPIFEVKPNSYKTFEALAVLYENSLQNEIRKNIQENKYFPIFTNRTATQFLITMFALEEVLKKQNDEAQRIVVLSNDDILKITPALKQKELKDNNINLILCDTAEETHQTLLDLNKLNADPQIMILPTKKVAEGFQIQKITHDKDTYPIFANVQECSADLATTCQALARADCIRARDEQKEKFGYNDFLIKANFFGITAELKKKTTREYPMEDFHLIYENGKIELNKQHQVLSIFNAITTTLTYDEPKSANTKLKTFTEFYQDNFKDTLTTSPEFAEKTFPTTLKSSQLFIEQEKNVMIATKLSTIKSSTTPTIVKP